MALRLAVDTNRLSDALGGDPTAVETLESAREVWVPAVVLGELRAGFARGSRTASNEARLAGFLRQPGIGVLDVTLATTLHYAAIYAALRKAGKPIPTNDLWIAAVAIEHGLSLYTRDAHFAHVAGLAAL